MRFAVGKTAVRLAQVSFMLWLMVACLPVGRVNGSTNSSGGTYTRPSWALGVVLPEGAKLEGGGGLSWENVRNVTVLVTLPTIDLPSDAVYAVLSLMISDGVVLQVASGIYPSNSTWLVYSMYIADVLQVPQHYTWVLNSSAPQAQPGDSEVISIFLSQVGGWSFRVADPERDSSIQLPFGLPSDQPPKAGDQEFFALESYSWNSSTFEAMGSMTLESTFLDGRTVSSGMYLYSNWDMIHSPLFVVGGSTPPGFVSVGLNGSTAMWSYGGTWQGNIQTGYDTPIAMTFLVGLAVSIAAVVVGIVYVTGRTGRMRRVLPE